MQSLADGLPAEIAQQVHPEWRKNEADYWAVREQLLEQYRDQWIGFANGQIIASGRSAVRVLHAADEVDSHSFVTCVGREHEPCRMRRAIFSYDAQYPAEPLPVMSVEFRTQPGLPGLLLSRVIPDTGSDASSLPSADCLQLGLTVATGRPGSMSGVGASTVATVVYKVWARVDGNSHPCRLHADPSGAERILGRDVLNQLDVLFRGPAQEVVINP